MVDERRYEEVTVATILRSSDRRIKPATVRKDSTLRDAVDAVIDSETRKVYVLDSDDKVVGTITLETLLRHTGYRLGVRKSGMTSFLQMLGEIVEEKVTESMTSPVRVREDELLANATKLMVESHLNDLPVVDDQNRLVGELNGLDILRMSRRFWV
jgi:CBS domain-containing protein